MTDRRQFTLRQVDQTRNDFALIEDHLEFIAGQLARLPTRAYLCRTLLLATASTWALLAVVLCCAEQSARPDFRVCDRVGVVRHVCARAKPVGCRRRAPR
jgi:hypothetical protein